jgi:hypothetical protein
MLTVALAAAIATAAGGVITTSGGDEPAKISRGYDLRDKRPVVPGVNLKRAVPNRQAFAVLAQQPNVRGRLRAKLSREVRRSTPRFLRSYRARDVRLSREVAGTALLLAPSGNDGEVCLFASQDLTCGPSGYAQTVGLTLIVQCDPSADKPKRQIAVLVPDGAPQPMLKKNGKEHKKLAVANNTAFTTDVEADAMTQANGSTLELPPLHC